MKRLSLFIDGRCVTSLATLFSVSLLTALASVAPAAGQSLMVGVDGAIHLDEFAHVDPSTPVIIQQAPMLMPSSTSPVWDSTGQSMTSIGAYGICCPQCGSCPPQTPYPAACPPQAVCPPYHGLATPFMISPPAPGYATQPMLMAAAVQEACWYARADALFLRRDNSSAVRAVVQDDATGGTVISTRDLNFATEPGGRLFLGRYLYEHLGVEAGYLGLHEWTASREAVGDNNLRLPGDVALATFDFLDADSMRVDYQSEIHSAEVNAVGRWRCLELLSGFRYFQFDDDLLVEATDLQTGTSDYSVATRNSLYGGQLGVRLTQQLRWFDIRATSKAALCGVDSEQRTFLGDFDNSFVLRNSSTSDGDLAFVGEVSLEGILPITRVLSLRGGYNVMWVEGVALAPDQLDFTDTPTSGQALNTDGGVFFYGAHAGVEARW
jgi:hypothetical protein